MTGIGNDSDDGEHFDIVCDAWGRMKKVKIARFVNEELNTSNFMVYKYVLCQHH